MSTNNVTSLNPFLDTAPREAAPSRVVHAKPVSGPIPMTGFIVTGRVIADAVVGVVGAHYGFSVEELKGFSREKRLARARHISAWLLHRFGWSNKETGIVLGCRDNSTIVASRRIVQQAFDSDGDARAILLQLEAAALGASQENK